MSNIDDLIETIGLIRDKADNYLQMASMRLPPDIHVEGLTGGMKEIKEMADAALRQGGRDE